MKQECIPVGCLPSATVAVSRGVYLVLGGVLGPGGVPGPRGCTWSQGVYLVLGEGNFLVPGGGGCTWSWGVPAQVLPPCGQTHTCKNITFATLLRTVIKESLLLRGGVYCYVTVLIHSTFSQTHKIGNIGINANFAFPYICSFLDYSHHMILVNVTLNISWHKRITFDG